MRAIFCPKCNSLKIRPYIAGITGVYQCLECGYIGSLIIEKDIIKSMKSQKEKNENEL